MASEREISRRLKDALVADRVVEDLSDGRYWLGRTNTDSYTWTADLARQIGLHDSSHNEDVHATLVLILPELDALFRDWPPKDPQRSCMEMALLATKDLSGAESLHMLMSGPKHWRSATIESGCKIDRLAGQLRQILQKKLSIELVRMLKQWDQWDLRTLYDRSGKAEWAAAHPPASASRPPERQKPEFYSSMRFQPKGRT